MLFERRAYTLRPENAAMFWQLQEKWNTPAQIPGLLARNVGYFQTLAGPAEQSIISAGKYVSSSGSNIRAESDLERGARLAPG